MKEPRWIDDAPPNEKWVEVLDGQEILIAKAIYGRDGMLPHWKTKDGYHCAPDRFCKWREIKGTTK